MSSVASEPSVTPNRTSLSQRNRPPGQARENGTPFAMMLDAGAPPEASPRRPEPAAATGVQSASAPKEAGPKDRKEAKDRTATTPQDSAAPDTPAATPAGVSNEAVATPARTAHDPLPFLPHGEDEIDGDSEPDPLVVAEQAPSVPSQPPAAAQVPPLPAAPDMSTPAATEDTSLAPTTAAPARPASAMADLEETGTPKTAGELPANAAKDRSGQRQAALQAASHAPASESGDQANAPSAESEAEVEPHAKSEPGRTPAGHEETQSHQTAGKPRPDAAQPAEQIQHKPAAPVMAAPDADASVLTQTQAHHQPAVDIATAAGNARSTLTAQTAVPLAGIAVEIAAQARAGNHRFDIRLDPPELGRIDVRLDVDTDGNVKSRLVIERADTYDLLRRDASTLERALQQAGLKTSDSGLEFTLRDQNAAQRDARDSNARETQRAIIPDADIAPADAASGYARLRGLGGGIDIRI